MTEGGSILTLTYYGSTKVFPNYNVMGVAKAALEATVRYLAASLGSKEHPRQRHLRRPHQNPRRPRHRRLHQDPRSRRTTCPLHRNVDQLEVGNAALFLSSPLASGITGEITYVDAGYNVTGL